MTKLSRWLTYGALALAVFTGLMVSWFSYNLWFNPIEFVENFSPPLPAEDYGALIRARWIANRILPFGVVIMIAVALKEYRAVGWLLLLRAGVDFFDGFVLTLAHMNGAYGRNSSGVMWGAYILGVLCLAGGLYLLRISRNPGAPAGRTVRV